jgi:hypothetical protein
MKCRKGMKKSCCGLVFAANNLYLCSVNELRIFKFKKQRGMYHLCRAVHG